MRSFLGAAALVAVQGQSACQDTAQAWLMGNMWIPGVPAAQLTGVEALCCGPAPAGSANGNGACAAQDAMTAQLENIASVCGAGDETITAVTTLIKDLMCSSHDGVYCLTNVLSFIDFGYLTKLTAGTATDLDLGGLLANPDRRQALCSSEKCRFEVFRKVSTALKGIDSAGSIIREISHDVFCGCANDENNEPCHGQDLFLATGGLNLDTACSASGEVSLCARSNARCNDLPIDPEVCREDPVAVMEQVASFTINFGNIKYAYFEANQALLALAMDSDFADNLIGLLAGDCDFEFVEATDGSLSLNVKIKGQALNMLLQFRDMLNDAADRAELELFVVDKLENAVPDDSTGRLVAGALLSADISITNIEITEQQVDNSAALPLAVGAAALASWAV